jgi:hypothetical protein
MGREKWDSYAVDFHYCIFYRFAFLCLNFYLDKGNYVKNCECFLLN